MSEGDPSEVIEDVEGPAAEAEEPAPVEAPAGDEAAEAAEEPQHSGEAAGEKSYADEFHEEEHEEKHEEEDADAGKPSDAADTHDQQKPVKQADEPATAKPSAASPKAAAPASKPASSKPAAKAAPSPAAKKPTAAPVPAAKPASKSPIAPKPAGAPKAAAPPAKPVVAIPAPKPVIAVPSPKPASGATTPSSPGKFTFSSAPHNNTAKPMPRENYSHSKYETMKMAEDNNKLCKKLLEISSGHAKSDGAFGQAIESASSINRRRREDRIAQENLALYKRLQSVKPTQDISRDALNKHFTAQKAYGTNARKFKPLQLTSTKALHSPVAYQQATRQVAGAAPQEPDMQADAEPTQLGVADDIAVDT